MFKKFIAIISIALITSAAAAAQNDLRIKKSVKIKMPGMEAMMANMPNNSLRDSMNQTQSVYIKGSRVRTDATYKKPTATGVKNKNISTIMQCDKNRVVTFNSENKKFYVQDNAVDAKAKKGGYVKISLDVVDTGERMKLFGFDSKHIKQTIRITPGPNSCMKQQLTMEVDGWYADIPTYACPVQPDVSQMQESKNCYDDVVYEMKGQAVTGFPVKEIKSFVVEGQQMSIEEEVTAVERTTLDASMFEPPVGYSPGNTKAEVSGDNDTVSQTAPSAPQYGATGMPGTSVPSQMPPSLAPPGAGVGTIATVVGGPKVPGTIRVGVVKPKVTTPETKNDENAGWDIAQAVAKSAAENLRAGGIDAIELTSDNPATECAEKTCDYLLYTTINQKRGGGFGLGKMVAMSAVMMAGAMVPGVGAMIATTVASQVMGQTMGKAAKAKDEFTFEHKLTGMDNTVVTQASTKKKTEKDGEDVLTPQIKSATDAVIGKIKK